MAESTVANKAAVVAYLHVVHHELVGELAPVLRVGHLLVHEAVDDRDAAVGAEGQGDVLVKLCEIMRNSACLVA